MALPHIRMDWSSIKPSDRSTQRQSNIRSIEFSQQEGRGADGMRSQALAEARQRQFSGSIVTLTRSRRGKADPDAKTGGRIPGPLKTNRARSLHAIEIGHFRLFFPSAGLFTTN